MAVGNVDKDYLSINGKYFEQVQPVRYGPKFFKTTHYGNEIHVYCDHHKWTWHYSLMMDGRRFHYPHSFHTADDAAKKAISHAYELANEENIGTEKDFVHQFYQNLIDRAKESEE